jgi:hypothetical protein
MARNPIRLGVGVAVAGVAILVAVLLGITLILGRLTQPAADPSPPEAALSQSDASVAALPTAQVAAPNAACAFDPLIPARGRGDGLFNADAALAGPTPPTSKAFVAVADEAAAQQRWRDAEVALIAACRAAAPAAGAPTVPLANAQSKLARFYTDYVRREADGPKPELRVRAQDLLTASAATYESVLGKDASRTRMAVRQAEALARGTTSGGESGAGTSVMGGPLMSNDEELGQVHEDLGRLHAQAASVTRDPEGFRRRAVQADARRQACHDDAGCLRRWYAQRRAQLLGEF